MGATSADGPFTPIAEGRHDRSDFGVFDWSLSAVGDLLGDPGFTGDLAVTYSRDDRDERAVELVYTPERFGTPLTFNFIGQEIFAWTGDFDVTTDGATYQGGAAVAITAQGTGRSLAEVVTSSGPQQLQTCWNSDGVTVWSEGQSALFEASGSPDACALPDVFGQ